jgi:peptidoglycan/xylan/chitin deacetylase (PgdA/CDA1 family)
MNDRPSEAPEVGALVISLDFELHWGVRDKRAAGSPYAANLLGARAAIPRILDAFRAHDIAATWATVGFLFASDREEIERFTPAVRPGYSAPHLDPYAEPVGRDEADDPIHFGLSLVRQIQACPLQEVGSHTFSHYYCLEPGQDADAFSADLESAVAIAAARGVSLRSIVFPRNQSNPAYAPVLARHGFACYRGTPLSWMHRAGGQASQTALRRGVRLLDSYTNLTGHQTIPWQRLSPDAHGLCDIPASFFLRPWTPGPQQLEKMRMNRLLQALTHAARAGEVVHLWWHPHNFGVYTDQNLAVLEQLLDHTSGLRERYGLLSLSMAEAALRAGAICT